jgi:hypothetical protein
LLLLAVVFVGIPISIWFDSYVSTGREKAKTQSQETAAYRKELLDKYTAIAMQKMWLGWGMDHWPKIGGMPSIDNYYLLLTLRHGVISSGLLLAILLALISRLFRNGMKNWSLLAPGNSLSFTLLGIFSGVAFSLATVYLGETLLPIFFMMAGFAEGHLVAGGDRKSQSGEAMEPEEIVVKRLQFRRVVTYDDSFGRSSS